MISISYKEATKTLKVQSYEGRLLVKLENYKNGFCRILSVEVKNKRKGVYTSLLREALDFVKLFSFTGLISEPAMFNIEKGKTTKIKRSGDADKFWFGMFAKGIHNIEREVGSYGYTYFLKDINQ